MEKNNYNKDNMIIPSQVSEPEILYAVRENKITTDYLNQLKEFSGLTEGILSSALNLSLKTFRNYKTKTAPLKPHLQEHVVALFALYKHGVAVFGHLKSFNDWLERPNYFFDNDAPIHFFSTISGIRYIDDRLSGIEYGDNA